MFYALLIYLAVASIGYVILLFSLLKVYKKEKAFFGDYMTVRDIGFGTVNYESILMKSVKRIVNMSITYLVCAATAGFFILFPLYQFIIY